MVAPLTSRALGRATLARQHLLERTPVAVADVPAFVDALGGLQAQHPQSFYTGLLSRIDGFTRADAAAVGELVETGALVRLAVMRSTIHLCSPRVAGAWRRASQPVLDMEMRQVVRFRALAAVDVVAVARRAAELLAEGELTTAQLGAALALEFEAPADALGYAARNALTLVQAPPRGVFERAGATRYRQLPGSGVDEPFGPDLEDLPRRWFAERPRGSRPLAAVVDQPGVRALIRTALAAYGPMSVRDLQRFTALTRLAEITDDMPGLVRLRAADGRDLLDVDGEAAALPDEDTPAPARLLYDYDAVLLAHDDRTRVIDPAVSARWPVVTNGVQHPAVLLDGLTAGYWALRREGRGGPGDPARLVVTLLRRTRTGERPALRREADRVLAFLAPGDGEREVRLDVAVD
ncbi:hypothetical protein C8046_15125 [Serinibacter arcticus]|uniref:Winged helix DNA-binding domain-containing protein n=1 Tax=Serinibacter arcticus TaxID=1655435 RepID=A0A2U1ZXQ9_9MICO|nr:crosslink repair DNA glycosylase YcaQ family protein [Serinibacter arcticus]PWD51777.1 hypothetical protein C8046_15125 [Serinibacter arcticus]